MNSKYRKKLACFAIVGTIAVTSLAGLTPSASALTLKNNTTGEVTVTTVQEVSTPKKEVDGNFVPISDEEAAERQAIRDSYWYSVKLDADGNVISPTNKTLYVPIGGTVQNGSTYEVEDGSAVYIRATEGSTILNRYGVDVTSVDSEMSDYEMEIAKAIYENYHTSKISFNQQDQMAAEMRMLEIKQSMADMEATGYLEQLKNDYSLAWEGHTWSVYTWILNCRPDVSAKLLELSKTPFTMYKLNPTAAASRADMAYFLMKLNSGFNPDTAATAEASAMSDVQSGAWYAEAAKYCQEHKLMSGVGNGQFDPEGTVTRGQLATVIYRLAGSPAVDTSENPFTDVQSDEYYAPAVEWCRQNKIINGTSDTTFAPDDAVTRQDMAVMFYRYNNKLDNEKRIYASTTYTEKYSDWSDVVNYATDSVKWAGEWGFFHMESTTVARTYENLMAEFKDYHFTDDNLGGYTFDSSSHLMGMFLRVGESAAYEYTYHSASGVAHEYTPETVRSNLTHEVVLQYDHTPTLEEMAGKIYSELGGREAGSNFEGARIVFHSTLGISYDADTNTVIVVC